MSKLYSEEFKRDAVRMDLTSGLTRVQLSKDLGVDFFDAVSLGAQVPRPDRGQPFAHARWRPFGSRQRLAVPTRRSAHRAIFDYINGFYNPRRCHSANGGKSPLAFERLTA